MSQDVDVIVIGAGAAGLSAAKQAAKRGLTYTLLEASHRIGGRAYTEELAPGIPFDLGCHWMHSASLNPFVAIADALGHEYVPLGGWRNMICIGGEWQQPDQHKALMSGIDETDEAVHAAAEAGRDVAVSDVIDLEKPSTSIYAYWHSLNTSRDIDEVSVFDSYNYAETDENWPLKNGYGTLVSDWGKDVDVSLNTKVEKINWGGKSVQVETSKGTVTGKRVVITVSTNILNSNQIAFDPPLPDWKIQAAHNLPLGVHNRIGIKLNHNPFGDEEVAKTAYGEGLVQLNSTDDVPMAIKIRPFGFDYVCGVTGGRHGEWLSKAGQQASVDYLTKHLVSAFGSKIKDALSDRTIVTAWDSDPWVMGAYSASKPGHGKDRPLLREPIEDRLYFAGEATSTNTFATAHGALISGVDVIDTIIDEAI